MESIEISANSEEEAVDLALAKLGLSRSEVEVVVVNSDEFLNAPVVIFVHGGAWMWGDKADLEEHASFFTEWGFILVCPNYRLAKENGKNCFPTPINDVACATAWIKSNAEIYGLKGLN